MKRSHATDRWQELLHSHLTSPCPSVVAAAQETSQGQATKASLSPAYPPLAFSCAPCSILSKSQISPTTSEHYRSKHDHRSSRRRVCACSPARLPACPYPNPHSPADRHRRSQLPQQANPLSVRFDTPWARLGTARPPIVTALRPFAFLNSSPHYD